MDQGGSILCLIHNIVLLIHINFFVVKLFLTQKFMLFMAV